MAIQTRGFEVSVMPQVSLPDPRLMAFNPTLLTQGASQGVGLASQIEQLKAFKAAQQEQEALRQYRIAATNAQNKGISEVAPVQTQNTIAKLNAESPYIPDIAAAAGETARLQATKAQYGQQLAELEAQLSQRNTINQFVDANMVASTAQNRAIAAQANANVAAKMASAAEQTVDADIQTMYNNKDAALKQSDTNLANAITASELQPQQAQLIATELKNNLANANDKAEIQMATARAQLAQTVATTENLLAHAQGTGGYAKDGKVMTQMMAQSKSLLDQREKINNATVPVINNLNKAMKLSEYEAATRNPDGSLKDGAELNREAEKRLSERNGADMARANIEAVMAKTRKAAADAAMAVSPVVNFKVGGGGQITGEVNSPSAQPKSMKIGNMTVEVGKSYSGNGGSVMLLKDIVDGKPVWEKVK